MHSQPFVELSSHSIDYLPHLMHFKLVFIAISPKAALSTLLCDCSGWHFVRINAHLLVFTQSFNIIICRCLISLPIKITSRIPVNGQRCTQYSSLSTWWGLHCTHRSSFLLLKVYTFLQNFYNVNWRFNYFRFPFLSLFWRRLWSWLILRNFVLFPLFEGYWILFKGRLPTNWAR